MSHNTWETGCHRLCNAMNRFSGIRTTSSCCGHGKKPLTVFFSANDLDTIARFLSVIRSVYFFGFQWDCFIKSRNFFEVSYTLSSRSKGAEAYREANCVANLLNSIFDYRKGTR